MIKMIFFSLPKVILRELHCNGRFTPFSVQDHIKAAMQWLLLAQDATENSGVSLRYSLVHGWAPSYPETTGYIIPTFLHYSHITKDDEYRQRAIKMSDWELSIQKEDGSFQGGALGEKLGSFAFDTGQIIFGLLEAFKNTNEEIYLQGAIKAGDWLLDVQEQDGTWRKFAFHRIPHTYYARVAWALAKLFLVTSNRKYEIAARKNIDWTIQNQRHNGWFDNASFRTENHDKPITHTIAYTIRGILETGMCLREEEYITAARKSSDILMNTIHPEGFFWASYNEDWEKASNYSCLTGNAQISIIFLKLFEITGKVEYCKTARLLNNYLKSKQNMQVNDKRIRGAIPGSHPVWGHYQRFAFPNWATKFFIDALLLEEKLGRSIL